MAVAFVYILFSETLDRHYTGATRLSVEERFEQHLSEWYNIHYTAAVKDWKIVFNLSCASFRQALLIESHIKRMKSSNYIANILKYPEIARKLLIKYSSEGER